MQPDDCSASCLTYGATDQAHVQAVCECVQGSTIDQTGSWRCDRAAARSSHMRHGTASRQLPGSRVLVVWRGKAICLLVCVDLLADESLLVCFLVCLQIRLYLSVLVCLQIREWLLHGHDAYLADT